MNVQVRGDTVVITGYVNAIERYSKPITDTLRNKVQTFIERIKAGVFRTALKRNDDVKVLLNHDMSRELANTKDGSAKLEEDNIGLRAEVTITDAEVVEKARQGKLVGWSFGFYANADEVGAEGNNTTRTVTDLDLVEVSILDDTKSPAYYGTSIEARCEKGGRRMEVREEVLNEEQVQEEVQGIDIEQLADIVANKVVAMLTEQKAEETEEEVQMGGMQL
jgi:HK97 family phage prohead protease